MQALAAGRLAEAHQAQRFQPVADLQCPGDHGIEPDIGRRIEIEDETPRHLRLVRRAVPGMQLDAAALRDRGQPLNTIDL